jgi:hypothetical protein
MLRGKIKAELSKTTRPHPTMLAALLLGNVLEFCAYVAVFLVRESFSACVSLIVPFVSTSRTYVSSGTDSTKSSLSRIKKLSG